MYRIRSFTSFSILCCASRSQYINTILISIKKYRILSHIRTGIFDSLICLFIITIYFGCWCIMRIIRLLKEYFRYLSLFPPFLSIGLPLSFSPMNNRKKSDDEPFVNWFSSFSIGKSKLVIRNKMNAR